MRGKLPRDYATQGSTFKTKKRDGDQKDIKGFEATVPAEECVSEQQRAMVSAVQPGCSSVHILPQRASQGNPHTSAAQGADAKAASAEPFHCWG